MSNPLHRRDLFRYGALGGLGALTGRLAALCNATAFDRRTDLGPTDKKMLCIFLRGGNDSVNTVIPIGDATYQSERQTAFGDVWIDPATTIAIPGSTYAALHPSLQRLQTVMAAGDAAFLHAVGTDQPTRSHFTEMQKLETAEERPVYDLATEGFVPRLLQQAGVMSPERGVSVARHIQRMFQSADADRILVHLRALAEYSAGTITPFVRMQGAPPTGMDPEGDALWGCCSFQNPNDPLDVLMRTTGERMLETQSSLYGQAKVWLYDQNNHDPQLFPTSVADVDTYFGGDPDLKTSGSLRLMRDLEESLAILSQTDARVTGVDFGGFDTHQTQLPLQALLLEILALGLESTWTSAINNGGSDLLVLVMTEFGRTNRVNGSSGTDHGVGTAFFAIAPGVNPGVYNCAATGSPQFGAPWTPLGNANPSPYEDAVPTQTHFQTVLAEVCERHFNLNSTQVDAIIPGFSANTGRLYRRLGFL